MLEVKLNMYQAAAIAAILFWIGTYLVEKVNFLKEKCIPAPLAGGIIFSVLNTILSLNSVMQITFDDTLQSFFMLVFFTTVGFTVNLPMLKKGAKPLLVMLFLSTIMVFMQNFLGGGIAAKFGLDPRLGVAAGSIALVGGPGTAAAFGKTKDEMGIIGGSSVGITAAVFGLVMGSIMGGPTAYRRIRQFNLKSSEIAVTGDVEDDNTNVFKSTSNEFVQSSMLLAVAMGVGTLVSNWLHDLTNNTFPIYLGAMLVAAVMRNVIDAKGDRFQDEEIEVIGNISLNLFLAMAMMSMKLWELVNLAVPLIIILIAQTALMFLFSYFVVFNVMGRNYNAAVQSAGFCGFAMGATSNAMANMQAITNQYGPAREAYFVIPLVGCLFIDFINAFVITGFLNWWA